MLAEVTKEVLIVDKNNDPVEGDSWNTSQDFERKDKAEGFW